MRKLVIILIILISGSNLIAQKKYDTIIRIANAIPFKLTRSTENIANYIKQNLSDPEDQLDAAFFWITKNIAYDINKLRSKLRGIKTAHSNKITLRRRKGVCSDYAKLFDDLVKKFGFKSRIISGYVKRNGEMLKNSHAWCGVLINNEWFLFDPTWAAGFVDLNNNLFTRRFNREYYKASPSRLIESHFPFDPIWQFLDYPIEPADFEKWRTVQDSTKTFFNYIDSIEVYNSQSKSDQLYSELRRIKNYGTINSNLERHIKSIYQNFYSIAIDHYNSSIKKHNKLIVFINKGFKPRRSREEANKMIDKIFKELNLIEKQLALVTEANKKLQKDIKSLKSSTKKLYKETNKQSRYINKYYDRI